MAARATTTADHRTPRVLFAAVLVLGLVLTSIAGVLGAAARDDTQARRLDAVVGRVVAQVQADLDAVVGVGTAVAVAATTGTANVETVLPGQVLLDRAVRRLTSGRQLGFVAHGLTGVLIVASGPDGVVAGVPATMRQSAETLDLSGRSDGAASPLAPTLEAAARSGSAGVSPPLDELIGEADLAIVVPLYQTAAALQPTATAASRQEDSLGWVVATVDASALLSHAVSAAGIAAEVAVTDVTTADRSPVAVASSLDGDGPARVVVLGVPARTWEIRTTTATTLLTTTERALPSLIIAVGLLLTAAATFLVGLLATQRSRALREVRRATRDLGVANAELERSNADLTEFAAVAAHDLKSPLAVILGLAPVISRKLPDDVDPLLTSMLDTVSDGARRMAALIDNLLDYASVGAATVQLEDVDLDALVRDVLGTMPLYIEQPSRVAVGVLPTVRADPQLLGQAFANVIGNALKFVPEGTEPQVHVSATRDGSDLLLAVEDNGVGIPPDERESVLQAFRRSSRTTAVEGTGLGLAIVGRVAFAHGGVVLLGDSALGGASVALRMPLVEHVLE